MMSPAKILVTIRRDDGKKFRIDDTLWSLQAAKGLDEPSIEVFSQKSAIGDGDIVTGTRVGARDIEFTARVRSAALNDVARMDALSFFRPRATYDLYVRRYGGERYAAACRLDGVSVPAENIYLPVTLKLTFLAPEGYWLSTDSFGKNIAGIEERCGYPYVATQARGRIYGVYSFAQTIVLDNDGDAEAYCKAVFKARSQVVNPKLTAGGSYVRVLCTLNAGDELVIDGRAKSVTINGANAATSQDKGSNYDGIVFGIGTNTVGYGADIGSNALDVYVYYNKRYLGA